jgi:hypothetical protein
MERTRQNLDSKANWLMEDDPNLTDKKYPRESNRVVPLPEPASGQW